jgi:curved DNA-binding protein CbpA
MRDYYQVLGLSRGATQFEIRTAFKRLAKLYHPDRNPGNHQAEEHFKAVNEAYHVLCNPVKKSQYDFGLYGFALTSYFDQAEWERQERRNRYDRWKKAQENRYRFDKNYFKIQGLAFLVFIVIGGFCFTVIHTAHYYVRKQQLEELRANTQRIKTANGLFGEGKFDDAFTILNKIEKETPFDFRYGFAKDSLLDALRDKANEEFRNQNFEEAIKHYKVLQQHEHPVGSETLQNISMCEYYLENYEGSIQALKHLHNQEPYNLALIYQIGMINLEKLDNPEEALQYFTLGKKLFKQNLSEVYGRAFQLVMNPSDAPDIYYHIFLGRAQANLRLKRYRDAITDCNWAVFLRRDQSQPYYYRAMAKMNKKEFGNICEDVMMAEHLGMTNLENIYKEHCH